MFRTMHELIESNGEPIKTNTITLWIMKIARCTQGNIKRWPSVTSHPDSLATQIQTAVKSALPIGSPENGFEICFETVFESRFVVKFTNLYYC